MINAHTNEHPDELLPWYVNGTLAADERDEVSRHIRECVHCREETTWLTALHRDVKQSDSRSPGEFGLRRLQRQIAQEKTQGKTQEKKRRVAAHRAGPPWLRPVLAVAAMLVIAVQGTLLFNLWPHDAPIITLAGPATEAVVLQLTFEPHATEAEIRGVLHAVQANIIEGPSRLGVYRIHIPADPSADEQIAAIIAALRAKPRVITHVARE